MSSAKQTAIIRKVIIVIIALLISALILFLLTKLVEWRAEDVKRISSNFKTILHPAQGKSISLLYQGMRRLPGRTKLFIGSWYIGAGNKPSVISQNSNKAFSKITELYQNEIRAKTGQKYLSKKISFTEKDRETIKKSISQKYRQQRTEKILIAFISLLITIGFLMFIAQLIKLRLTQL